MAPQAFSWEDHDEYYFDTLLSIIISPFLKANITFVREVMVICLGKQVEHKG